MLPTRSPSSLFDSAQHAVSFAVIAVCGDSSLLPTVSGVKLGTSTAPRLGSLLAGLYISDSQEAAQLKVLWLRRFEAPMLQEFLDSVSHFNLYCAFRVGSAEG